jgi:D-alanine-D-alanine ligase
MAYNFSTVWKTGDEPMSNAPTFKHIAVLLGGPSSEREVSLRSGAAVAAALRTRGHRVTEVLVGTDSAFTLPPDADVAFVAMHGRFGEDGTIQGMLRAQGIRHTGSSPEACARAFDKSKSKPVMAQAGIPTPPFEFLRSGEARTLPLPVVVKPVRQGSSVGISRVFHEADWPAALARALELDDTALVEEFIPGRELTVGVVGGEALPVIEIIAPDGNFDYHAKYTPGVSQHVVPAALPSAVAERCQAVALQLFDALGCSGMARVDIRLRPDGELFVLELNNIPGLTEISLLPDAARAHGWSFPELCERILSMVE